MGQLTTFQDQYELAQRLSHFTDDVITAAFKKDINTGCTKLMAGMHRSYLRVSRFTDLAAGQQYYQYPQDCREMRNFKTHIGGIERSMSEVTDEEYWDRLNQVVLQGLPYKFFVRMPSEVGLYPAPGADVPSGGELVFTRKHLAMTKDDYTTGTVTVSEGDDTVVGVGTVWTQDMAGRAFEVTDGSDGNWYRILSVESATSLTLENVYQGLSGGAIAYRIGESAFIPEEYQETAVWYALSNFYLGRDSSKQTQYLNLYKANFEELRSEYGRKASSSVIDASRRSPIYDPLRSNISIQT